MTNFVGSRLPSQSNWTLWDLEQGAEQVRAEHRGQVYLAGWAQMRQAVLVLDPEEDGPACALGSCRGMREAGGSAGARAPSGRAGRKEGRGGSILGDVNGEC